MATIPAAFLKAMALIMVEMHREIEGDCEQCLWVSRVGYSEELFQAFL